MEIKVLVSSPSDQDEEALVAIQAVEHLNEILSLHGHSLSVVNWRKNTSTGRSERAQEVINDQISNCNAIIAIFGLRFGTPTGDYLSGTEEEVRNFISRRPSNGPSYDLHVFFNATAIPDPLKIDTTQLSRVQLFREELTQMGIVHAQFSSKEQLRKLVELALNTAVAKSKPVEAIENDPLSDFEELGVLDAVEEGQAALNAATEHIAQIGNAMSEANSRATNLNSSNIADMSDFQKREFLSNYARILSDCPSSGILRQKAA